MSTSPTDAVKAAMAETNAIFNSEVCGKRNFDAIDMVYTTDSRILPPGGRGEIRRLLAAERRAVEMAGRYLER